MNNDIRAKATEKLIEHGVIVPGNGNDKLSIE